MTFSAGVPTDFAHFPGAYYVEDVESKSKFNFRLFDSSVRGIERDKSSK
jgi:hypothetical protein